MNKKNQKLIFFGTGIILISAMSLFFKLALASDEGASKKAVVFRPPSNVRVEPNGRILCTITSVRTIKVYPYSKEWYDTSACGTGKDGYIHISQIHVKGGGYTFEKGK